MCTKTHAGCARMSRSGDTRGIPPRRDVTTLVVDAKRGRSGVERFHVRPALVHRKHLIVFSLSLSFPPLALTFFQFDFWVVVSRHTQDGQTDRQTDRQTGKERKKERNRSFVVVFFSRVITKRFFLCVRARTTTESGGLQKDFCEMRHAMAFDETSSEKKNIYVIP